MNVAIASEGKSLLSSWTGPADFRTCPPGRPTICTHLVQFQTYAEIHRRRRSLRRHRASETDRPDLLGLRKNFTTKNTKNHEECRKTA
jgi:hypothetical protein